jgi:branched-chain amino acid transport system permease protein
VLKRPPLSVAIFFVLLVALLLVLPWFGGAYTIKFATRLVILAAFVLSLDLLIGVTGLVSFGHAAFFGVGAYAVYFVSPEAEPANALVALLAGAALAGFAALVVGAFAMLTRGFYFIMVTLAAGQMMFSLFHDTDIAKGSDGAYVNVKPDFVIGGASLIDFSNRTQFYYVCLASLILLYFKLSWLVRSPFGRALQGIRINEARMAAMGFDSYRFKLAAFVISGAVAGYAGALFACIDGFVTPELMSWHQSGLAIMMVVLGGGGTLYGPILGALAYASLEEILKTASLVGPLVAAHWRLGTGATLILAVLLMPDGLAGFLRRAVRKREAGASALVEFEAPEKAARPPRRAKTLSTEALTRLFGGLVAVDGVTLRFEPNRVHAIIGPNGAGKTTFTNLLSGAIRPSAGRVKIDDLDVTGWPAHRIARRGLGRSFQRTTIFGAFTVAENCALAAQARAPSPLRLIDTRYRYGDEAAIAHALAVTGLADRAGAVASRLSNGEQRQLEIAMLLASGADLLILDEPLAGMGPEETQRVVALLRDLAIDHTIILIEHDMDAVFAAADTLTVLVQGRLLAHGTPDDIRSNEAVLEAYLGHAKAGAAA